MKHKLMVIFLMIIMVISMMAGCTENTENEAPETYSEDEESKYEALDRLKIKIYDIDPVKGKVPEREAEKSAVNYELPDIANYDPITKGSGDLDVEIFLPSEENGSNIQDVIKFAAEKFNESKIKNDEGQIMSVTIRTLDSALAEDFIQSGAYMPKGYIASNELYGSLMTSIGIESKIVYQKLVGNTMGLAIEKEKYDELFKNNESISAKDIVKANIDGKLKIGYTNPTNNPTGLNFVISMLSGFDDANPNSFEATTDFTEFQNTATVSFSTEQMLKSAQNGSINAFVIEHQAFDAQKLDSQFVFVPFGMRHDYPLYQMPGDTEKEIEVLKKFGEIFYMSDVIKYADDLKFNEDSEYKSDVTMEKYPIGTIQEILDYWKQNKAAKKQIVAVFVSDVSGSMEGEKIKNLMESLKNSMKYISEDSKVGMICYDNRIYKCLPIGVYDKEQQEYFSGAIDNMLEIGHGGTATNNALCAAIRMISEEEEKNKDIKPVIILLSDGQTQSGYSLQGVRNVIKAFGYPIYTIGYSSDEDSERVKEMSEHELMDIAEINEGIYINSSTDDVGYTIKTLFNAEM